MRYCGHGTRSYTDAVTNMTLLDSVDVYKHLKGILSGRLPKAATSAFLHEMTHHWCFHSPVGLALSLLHVKALRAATAAVQKGRGTNTAAFDALDDVIKYRSAHLLLRPIAEGLAMYAEFDVAPGPSHKLSPVMGWAAYFFSPSKDEAVKQLLGVLTQYRLDPAQIRRKAAFLLDSVDWFGGGYLAGYLSVKNIWIEAFKADQIFVDQDLFFSFLRSYIFEDYRLASLLLDPHLSLEGAANAISLHVSKHIRSFFGDLHRSGRKFLESPTTGSGLKPPPAWPMPTWISDLRSDAIAEGKSRLEQALQALDSAVEAPLIHHKELIRIGVTDVRVRVDERGHATCTLPDGSPAAMFWVRDAQQHAREAAGQIFVYFAPYRASHFFGVAREGRLIAFQMLKKGQGVVEDHFRQVVEVAIAHWHAERNTAATIDKACALSPAPDLISQLESGAGEALDGLYQPLVCLFTPPTFYDSHWSSIKRAGFRDLLGTRPDLVQAVAHVGLASSVVSTKAAVAAALQRAGRSWDAVFRETRDVTARTHVPFIVHLPEMHDLVCTYV